MLIEIERHQQTSRPGALDDVHKVTLISDRALQHRRLAGRRWQIGNGRGRAGFQIRENVLDLSRKGQLRVDSGPVQIAPD